MVNRMQKLVKKDMYAALYGIPSYALTNNITKYVSLKSWLY